MSWRVINYIESELYALFLIIYLTIFYLFIQIQIESYIFMISGHNNYDRYCQMLNEHYLCHGICVWTLVCVSMT